MPFPSFHTEISPVSLLIVILIVFMLGSRCLLSEAFTKISSKILYNPGTYVTVRNTILSFSKTHIPSFSFSVEPMYVSGRSIMCSYCDFFWYLVDSCARSIDERLLDFAFAAKASVSLSNMSSSESSSSSSTTGAFFALALGLALALALAFGLGFSSSLIPNSDSSESSTTVDFPFGFGRPEFARTAMFSSSLKSKSESSMVGYTLHT
mmetsp:Transcript_15614/g.27731  ORF Transcript_15614/g.27731 Transcript_15614/m.27731 type:complete len:208 (-) Transcript_15614:151-774(-)